MKKLSRLVTLAVLAVSLATPLTSFAVDSVYCPDGSVVADVSQCSTVKSVYCPDGSVVFNVSQCPAAVAKPTTTTPPPSSNGGINIGAIKPYGDSIKNIINDILVPVLIAIAFITFLWGVFRYFIWGADNETERETGKKFAMWGIIGFVVILSLWGIVALVGNTLNLKGGSATENGLKPPTI